MTRADYERYIHSNAWRTKREMRLEHDRHKCLICGREAEEVHHLNYDHLGAEEMNDIVSLCKQCHSKAEELYDAKKTPWAMSAKDLTPNSFMAALRVDTACIAPKVFDYLKSVHGGRIFESLMRLRQPESEDSRIYWSVLRKDVSTLCSKRYSLNCAADRADMMLNSITNHVVVIGIQQIEHELRNLTQAELYRIVHDRHNALGKWTLTAKDLGLTNGTLNTLKSDNGSSFGPFLRESVRYYLGLDAVAGIRPIEGFTCLTKTDYMQLNRMADEARAVSEEEYRLS